MKLWPREFRSPGLSLVPVLLGCSVVVPIIVVVLSAERAATGEHQAKIERSDPNAALSTTCEELGTLFRPAILSSFRVRANELDRTNAATPIALGQWILPREHDPRPGVRFLVSEGLVVTNEPGNTSLREIEFVMDDGESSNGIDDDGDGLIDEGVLMLRKDNTESVLMANVEMFSVAFEGRALRITLGCALKKDGGEFNRAVMVRDFLVRNS